MHDDEIRAIMKRFRQPAIMLRRPFPPVDLPQTNSHLGGLPSLPSGTDWPRASDGEPLHFLAQIACGELPPTGGVLPESGVLFFFGRSDADMDWGVGDPRDDCRVIFRPGAAGAPTPPPKGLQDIEGGYSSLDAKFHLPGDSGRRLYPSWPIVGRPIGSWPDFSALPGNVQDTVRSWQSAAFDPANPYNMYENAVTEARRREHETAVGISSANQLGPHWGIETDDSDGRRYTVTLPEDDERPFPQVWIMAERIARRLAQWAGRELELDPQRQEESGFEGGLLQSINDAALRWVETAQRCGLDAEPDPMERDSFRTWLASLADHDHVLIRSEAGRAIESGMKHAIGLFSGGSPTAARLIPERYYAELSYRLLSHFCGHQMLGNAPSRQEARPFERDEVLLLHLESDDGVGFMFGDLGEAEFWIRKDDLAARRFETVTATICGS